MKPYTFGIRAAIWLLVVVFCLAADVALLKMALSLPWPRMTLEIGAGISIALMVGLLVAQADKSWRANR